MEKRGPKRLVKDAIRVGEYGNTHWRLVLSCSHELDSKRKPKVGEDKVCCKKCISSESLAVATVEMFEDGWETADPLVEVRIRAMLASKVGVTIDQVEMVNGTATIFLDAQQVRSLTR